MKNQEFNLRIVNFVYLPGILIVVLMVAIFSFYYKPNAMDFLFAGSLAVITTHIRVIFHERLHAFPVEIYTGSEGTRRNVRAKKQG